MLRTIATCFVVTAVASPCFRASVAVTSVAVAQVRAAKTLDVYVIDAEGGNATLFVAPSGESVLIDTGNPPPAAVRDAERIMAAINDAGLKHIDHLMTTHWHGDHFGAMSELSSRIPIRHYIDHGPTVQPQPLSTEFLAQTYPTLYGKAKHTIAKAGDRLPVAGLEWRIATSAGKVMKDALPGAGARNQHCATFKPQDDDTTENAQSVGSVVTFGAFRVVHLGDLTWNKEFELMCPTNPIGTVDLSIVSHHGQPSSNAEVLVHAIQARVAILNNGTRKGGQPSAMKILYSAPRLEDLWQVHFSQLSGQEYTVPGVFIANVLDDQPTAMPIDPVITSGTAPGAAPVHNGPAYWIKVSAQSDGMFSVTNARNGFTKAYAARRDSR